MKENKILFVGKSYEDLKRIIRKNNTKKIFCFMNANDVYEFHNNESFRRALEDKHQRIVSVDGMTLSVVLSIKNLRRVRRIQGPTFTEKFLKDIEMMKDKKHFFFGIGKEGLDVISKKYPLLKRKNIYGIKHPLIKGYSFPNSLKKKMISIVNGNKINYLWLGAGCPRQEILANEVFEKINVKNIFNVGVALEYLQDKRKRAPLFFQKIGMEWAYRLFNDFGLTFRRLWPCTAGSFYAFFTAQLKE